MTTPFFRVDAAGVHVLSLPAAQAEMQRRFASIFGGDLDMAAQTPQGQLAGLEAVIVAEIGEGLVAQRNAMSVDDAAGAQQDVQGGLLDIPRRLAVRSRVTATLTGVAGTGVSAGSRAKTAADDVFRTLADAVLSPSGVSVEMESVAEGPIPAAAGALARIVTVIAGWETVTNASAAVLGMARESDTDYRATYRTRTAYRAIGPMDALKGAIEDALGGRTNPQENRTDAAIIIQEWPIRAHHLLAIVEHGTDSDIRRAVENHRGMGVGTMTAISGGVPTDTALAGITNGTITWDGTAHTGLDLSGLSTGDARATALETLLNATTGTRPVSVRFVDGRYLVAFAWMPGTNPVFGDGTDETAFGLNPDAAVAALGPYVRPREKALTLTTAATRGERFPADGLQQIRAALLAVGAGYAIGDSVWLNDFLSAAERIPGTRVTSTTLQSGGVDISGVIPPLDTLWTLATGDLTITIT